MEIVLTDEERAALEAAAAGEPRVRRWKRPRAVLLLADGKSPPAVAAALDCAPSSVDNWAAAWRARGLDGLREGPHHGIARRLDGGGEAALEALWARTRRRAATRRRAGRCRCCGPNSPPPGPR